MLRGHFPLRVAAFAFNALPTPRPPHCPQKPPSRTGGEAIIKELTQLMAHTHPRGKPNRETALVLTWSPLLVAWREQNGGKSSAGRQHEDPFRDVAEGHFKSSIRKVQTEKKNQGTQR